MKEFKSLKFKKIFYVNDVNIDNFMWLITCFLDQIFGKRKRSNKNDGNIQSLKVISFNKSNFY